MYLRDPAAVFKFTPPAGMISHSGVFAMIATGAICLFVYRSASRDRLLLFWTGVFSLMITHDDFFMIHEAVCSATMRMRQLDQTRCTCDGGTQKRPQGAFIRWFSEARG